MRLNQEFIHVYYIDQVYKDDTLKLVDIFNFIELSSKFKRFENIFNKLINQILSFYRNNLNYVINLKLNISFIFELLYNLFEKKLSILKEYIDKHLINEFIIRSNFLAKALILFVKKFDKFLHFCVNY